MKETSLDDFLGQDGDDDSNASDEIEQATPTSRWEPGGTTCEGCGETVNRTWIDEDQTLCATCKDWS